MVIISSDDIVQDILDDFSTKLKLKLSISSRLQMHFETKYRQEIDRHFGYQSTMKITITVLVIHIKKDTEILFTARINIHNN